MNTGENVRTFSQFLLETRSNICRFLVGEVKRFRQVPGQYPSKKASGLDGLGWQAFSFRSHLLHHSALSYWFYLGSGVRACSFASHFFLLSYPVACNCLPNASNAGLLDESIPLPRALARGLFAEKGSGLRPAGVSADARKASSVHSDELAQQSGGLAHDFVNLRLPVYVIQ